MFQSGGHVADLGPGFSRGSCPLPASNYYSLFPTGCNSATLADSFVRSPSAKDTGLPDSYAGRSLGDAPGEHTDRGEASSLLVKSGTNPAQASALLSLALDHSNFFTLNLHKESGNQAAICTLNIIQAGSRQRTSTNNLQQNTVQTVFIPSLATTENSGNLGVAVLRVPVNSLNFQASSGSIFIQKEMSSFSLGARIHKTLLATPASLLHLSFDASSASSGLQALAIARAHLSGDGHELVAFMHWPESVSFDDFNPQALYKVHVASVGESLGCHAQATLIDVLKSHEDKDQPSISNLESLGMQGWDAGLVSKLPPEASRMPSINEMAMGTAMSEASASIYTQQHMQQQAAILAATYHAAAAVAMTPTSLVAGMNLCGLGAVPGLSFHRLSTQSDSAISSIDSGEMSSMNSAMMNLFTDSRSPQFAPQLASRNLRPDYVIVTEDTQVKNAAGAIAKVLGRVAHTGLSCPLYTDKRGDSFTAVIGTAVKAIAVSRGYVYNEQTGHEVAFQPYFRTAERLSAPPALEQYIFEKKMMESLCHMPGSSVVLKSIDNQVDSASAASAESNRRSRMEIAFDVFKLQVTKEPDQGGHSPVKVTAHSRVPVVSSIICRILEEAGTVELVSAGGRAMQIAIHSVIHARAQLSALNVDLMLLPRFHTVDTTSSHGYESVFLRFCIIRAVPAPLQNDMAPTGSTKFMISPDMTLR